MTSVVLGVNINPKKYNKNKKVKTFSILQSSWRGTFHLKIFFQYKYISPFFFLKNIFWFTSNSRIYPHFPWIPATGKKKPTTPEIKNWKKANCRRTGGRYIFTWRVCYIASHQNIERLTARSSHEGAQKYIYI